LHRSLGFSDTIEQQGWKVVWPCAGQVLGEVAHLFTKLDDAVIEEETARLGS
jgi:methionyl-tRNA synthetase